MSLPKYGTSLQGWGCAKFNWSGLYDKSTAAIRVYNELTNCLARLGCWSHIRHSFKSCYSWESLNLFYEESRPYSRLLEHSSVEWIGRQGEWGSLNIDALMNWVYMNRCSKHPAHSVRSNAQTYVIKEATRWLLKAPMLPEVAFVSRRACDQNVSCISRQRISGLCWADQRSVLVDESLHPQYGSN